MSPAIDFNLCANPFNDYLNQIAAGFGKLANFIPRVYTYYISTALFAIFGLKMIRDGWNMSPNDAQEELDEVQADLKKRDDEVCLERNST